MTIYGESPDQFRPRPRGGTLVVFSLAVTLLAAWLAALISATVTTAAAGLRLAGEAGFPLFLSPAGNLLLPGTTALTEDPRLAVAPLLLIVLALVLLTVWPTGSSLGSRLSSRLIARVFALAALTASLTRSPADWLAGELSASGMWRPAVALAALLVLWRGELSVRNLLGGVFDASTPQRRLRLWLLVSLPQYLLWALLGLGQSSADGAWAAVYAILVSVLAATAGQSAGHWERVDRPRLVEDTILAGACALLVTVAGYGIFGLPALAPRSHAVVLGSDPIARRVPLDTIRLTTTEQLSSEEAEAEKGEAAEGEKSVIEIRWSDPEKQRKRDARQPDEAPADPPTP